MRDTNFLDILLIRGQSQKRVRAFTLIELLITVAILGTLSAISVPTYKNYVDESRISTAIVEIQKIAGVTEGFRAERGRLPNTLAEAGLPVQLDPWGRPYEYLRLEGVPPADRLGHRKDRSNNPLNADFDLYSMGKDGRSQPELGAPFACDDIVRANSGAYVGLASEY